MAFLSVVFHLVTQVDYSVDGKFLITNLGLLQGNYLRGVLTDTCSSWCSRDLSPLTLNEIIRAGKLLLSILSQYQHLLAFVFGDNADMVRKDITCFRSMGSDSAIFSSSLSSLFFASICLGCYPCQLALLPADLQRRQLYYPPRLLIGRFPGLCVGIELETLGCTARFSSSSWRVSHSVDR